MKVDPILTQVRSPTLHVPSQSNSQNVNQVTASTFDIRHPLSTIMSSNVIKYSHTLWSPSDTVKDVAELLGIANLPDEVSKTLAMDIEYRIHEIIEQAMKFMRHSKRTTLTTSDLSQAMRVLNVEPLYGYQSSKPLSYREAMVGPGQTLYYIDDDEVDFEKIINQPLPKVPRAVSFTAHWLAIEGVQPAIPQNPLSSDIKAMPIQLRGSQTNHSISALSADADVKPLVKHVISKELQLYFDRVISALVSTNPNDESLRNSALTSLTNDPGLHQLVPYFIHFIQEQVAQNLKSNLQILSTMLDVIHALMSNPTIFIEPYIHHVIPSILTPLLAKRIGPKPVTRENYAVRDFAASLLGKICQIYGDTYYTLKPRVTRTLLKGFMDPSRPAGALYGSIVGITALGPEIVRVVILGNVRPWYQSLLPKIGSEEDRNILTNAVIQALDLLRAQAPDITDSELSDEEKGSLEKRVGESLAQKILDSPNGPSIARGILFGPGVSDS